MAKREEWCAFTAGDGLAIAQSMDSWIPKNARRVSEWEPVAVGAEWVGPNGYSLAESSPSGFATVVLWRCRVEVVDAE